MSCRMEGESEKTSSSSEDALFTSTAASISKLRKVSVDLTAQMAYHCGEFAATAELARCGIKMREEEEEEEG